MKKELIEMFRKQYAICLDEQGKPQAVGRRESEKLIDICQELDPDHVYGDAHFRMDLPKIQELAKKLGIIEK